MNKIENLQLIKSCLSGLCNHRRDVMNTSQHMLNLAEQFLHTVACNSECVYVRKRTKLMINKIVFVPYFLLTL